MKYAAITIHDAIAITVDAVNMIVSSVSIMKAVEIAAKKMPT